jgi:hypothetical protein
MQFSEISEFDTPIHGVFEADKPYANYSTIAELLGIKRPESPELIKPPPKIDGELLVGLSIADAEHKYPGIDICPCKIDGVGQIILLIYCPTRHNVEIENNIITKYIDNC